jgi:hypothetical protein
MRRIVTAAAAGLLMWVVALAPGMADAAVSSLPATTPQLGTSGTDGTIEQIRQMVQCGTTMYAVGSFSAVKNPNSTTLITRNNAFAFSATAPYRVTAWDPNVASSTSAKPAVVNSVACAAGGGVLLAGQFDMVKGATVTSKNLVKVDGATGVVDPSFLWTFNGTSSPSGLINHIEVVQGHLLVGGNFTAAAPRPSYLASVSPTTGRLDDYALPAISGTYVYTGVKSNTTKVFNMAVSPSGTSLIVTGVFTSVGGVHHEQLFRLDMGTTSGTANGWSPADLYSHCSTVEPFYAQDAAWSPDGSKVYVANTGYKLFDDSRPTTHPRTGPCDSAIAYNATLTTEFTGHLWQNYTGCDSLYSIGADATTVYIAGHERFIDNPNTCDALGTGGRAQPGLGELDPTTGHSVAGPNRGRGLGADDVLVTTAGLWIASDNQANTDTCAGKHAHMGLCYLPYA